MKNWERFVVNPNLCGINYMKKARQKGSWFEIIKRQKSWKI